MPGGLTRKERVEKAVDKFFNDPKTIAKYEALATSTLRRKQAWETEFEKRVKEEYPPTYEEMHGEPPDPYVVKLREELKETIRRNFQTFRSNEPTWTPYLDRDGSVVSPGYGGAVDDNDE